MVSYWLKTTLAINEMLFSRTHLCNCSWMLMIPLEYTPIVTQSLKTKHVQIGHVVNHDSQRWIMAHY